VISVIPPPKKKVASVEDKGNEKSLVSSCRNNLTRCAHRVRESYYNYIYESAYTLLDFFEYTFEGNSNGRYHYDSKSTGR
jgi:hypothetical protein